LNEFLVCDVFDIVFLNDSHDLSEEPQLFIIRDLVLSPKRVWAGNRAAAGTAK
jgi:hypothetical protein